MSAAHRGAHWVEHSMLRASAHSRTGFLGGLLAVLVLIALIVATAGSGTVEVANAETARKTALGLRPGLRSVGCERVVRAWSCAGVRRGRPWTCRVFLTHTTRQTPTGSCHRGREAR